MIIILLDYHLYITFYSLVLAIEAFVLIMTVGESFLVVTDQIGWGIFVVLPILSVLSDHKIIVVDVFYFFAFEVLVLRSSRALIIIQLCKSLNVGVLSRAYHEVGP